MRKSMNIELLRIISVLMVILVHILSEFMIKGLYSGEVIISLSSFFKVCVPCFLMIMGYLYNPKKSVKEIWTKNIYRLIIPLLFFSLFYQLFTEIIIEQKTLNEIWGYELFINTFGKSVLATSAYHLWYIYGILIIYALYPMFSFICEDNEKCRSLQRYLIIIGFIVMIIFPTISGLFQGTSGFLEIFNYGYLYMVLYFIIGNYLKYLLPKIKVNKYIFLLGYFIMIGISILSANSFEFNTGCSYLFLTSFSYQSIFIALASISFFIFIMKLKIKDSKFLLFISNKTLIVYYVHLIFMNLILLKTSLIKLTFNELIIYSALILLVIYICSLLVAIVYRTIISIFKKYIFRH